jgi:hypothetical protein
VVKLAPVKPRKIRLEPAVAMKRGICSSSGLLAYSMPFMSRMPSASRSVGTPCGAIAAYTTGETFVSSKSPAEAMMESPSSQFHEIAAPVSGLFAKT